MLGLCRLCNTGSADLRRSHTVPASVYRLLRSQENHGNPNPWLLNASRELQTSFQDAAYLLCHKCEQRFCDLGERWTLRNGVQRNGTSRISSALQRAKAYGHPGINSVVIPAAACPDISVTSLAHFATGVIWRASQYPDGASSVRLGPYAEEFRAYLNGENEFPANAVLNVCGRVQSEVGLSMRFPTTVRVDSVHVSSFVMPGLAFHLFVGKAMPLFASKFCVLRSPGNPILISSNLEKSLKQNLLDVIREVESR